MFILGTRTPFILFETAAYEGLRLEHQGAGNLIISPEVRKSELSDAYLDEIFRFRRRFPTSKRLAQVATLIGRHLYWQEVRRSAFQWGPGFAEFAVDVRSLLLDKAIIGEYEWLTGEDLSGD